MKFVRYEVEDQKYYGIVENDKVKEIEGCIYGEYEVTDKERALDEVTLLPPVEPSKLIAIGLNYLDHVKEGGADREPPTEPLIFLKAPTSICGNGEPIIIPKQASLTHYEAEIGVVIKNKIKRVTEEEALDHALGYIVANDVSERVFQRGDGQWTRAKSFDTFCPVGDYIVTDIDPNEQKISCHLNGEVKQDSNTNNMIFNIQKIISYVSDQMTLLPGDVIITGTPAGVGPIEPGDKVRIEVEEVGVLENPVVAEA